MFANPFLIGIYFGDFLHPSLISILMSCLRISLFRSEKGIKDICTQDTNQRFTNNLQRRMTNHWILITTVKDSTPHPAITILTCQLWSLSYNCADSYSNNSALPVKVGLANWCVWLINIAFWVYRQVTQAFTSPPSPSLTKRLRPL